MMERMDAHYPGFNFASHKGYSTPEHFAALEEHKPCILHRRSFAPIAEMLGLVPTQDDLFDDAEAMRTAQRRQRRRA
jgi:ribonuclease HII